MINLASATIVKNLRGQEVGRFSNGVYFTERSVRRRQVFLLPKYKNAMAVDEFILDQLEKAGCVAIVIYVPDFEDKGFYAVIGLKKFDAIATAFSYDRPRGGYRNGTGWSPQKRLAMNDFRRAYSWDDVDSIVSEIKLDLLRERQKLTAFMGDL